MACEIFSNLDLVSLRFLSDRNIDCLDERMWRRRLNNHFPEAKNPQGYTAFHLYLFNFFAIDFNEFRLLSDMCTGMSVNQVINLYRKLNYMVVSVNQQKDECGIDETVSEYYAYKYLYINASSFHSSRYNLIFKYMDILINLEELQVYHFSNIIPHLSRIITKLIR
jgi:hypothetical protein